MFDIIETHHQCHFHSYFDTSLLSILLNTKTNVVMNLKPFNRANKSISLLLIANSVSLRCISGLKKIKISTLEDLEKPLKACLFYYFSFFFVYKIFTILSLYKGLLEPTFIVCIIV